jgi:hypothetical protein
VHPRRHRYEENPRNVGIHVCHLAEMLGTDWELGAEQEEGEHGSAQEQAKTARRESEGAGSRHPWQLKRSACPPWRCLKGSTPHRDGKSRMMKRDC